MNRRLRIALIAPVWFPVPPPRYGGIESIVSLLADGLVEAGHDVTLFASGDSRSKAALSFTYIEAPSSQIGIAQIEVRHALACYERANEFDIINDHSGPPAAVIGGAVETPVLHTVHGPLGGEPGELYASIGRVAPRVGLISVSRSQRAARPELPWAANIPNAIDLSRYPFDQNKGEYLVYLGRICPEKGAHRAVEVARAANVPLKLAGKRREPAERSFFATQVEPYLGDGIEYLGEISHEEKVQLLQRARATLFPIEWDEPFGLVMIESLACGTPVIATRRGAVPEVLEHRKTGIIVDRSEQIPGVLTQADALDRGQLRRAVERRFTVARMLADYEAAFTAAIEDRRKLPAEAARDAASWRPSGTRSSP
jgi:glycosyltransferase involved in cell wall biosynthesis